MNRTLSLLLAVALTVASGYALFQSAKAELPTGVMVLFGLTTFALVLYTGSALTEDDVEPGYRGEKGDPGPPGPPGPAGMSGPPA